MLSVVYYVGYLKPVVGSAAASFTYTDTDTHKSTHTHTPMRLAYDADWKRLLM